MKRILLPIALLAAVHVASAADPYRLKFVEYIEATTNRLGYIDTEYVPNANTEIEMEFSFTTNLEAKTYVFGVYGSAGRFQFSYGPENCLFGFGGNSNYDGGITGFAYNTARHVVKYVHNDGFYFDGTKVVAKAGVDLINWGGTSKNLYLGACNSNGSVNNDLIAPLRIYSCKIWDNGELVRNFMPAETETQVPVLYDTVQRKLYYAHGNKWHYVTGGAEVPITDYRKATYIEANRSAYINTGYTPNENTELEMDFSFTEELEVKTYVFGSYGASNKGRFMMSYGPASTGCFIGYGATYTNSFVLPYNTDRHVVKYVPGSGKGFYFDGTRVDPSGVNLTKWSGTGTKLFLGQVNPNNGNPNSANLSPIRIYSCKIWENGTPKRDLVPKQRVLDGKNGLYDNVTGNFYAYYGDEADFTAVLPPAGIIILFL